MDETKCKAKYAFVVVHLYIGGMMALSERFLDHSIVINCILFSVTLTCTLRAIKVIHIGSYLVLYIVFA